MSLTKIPLTDLKLEDDEIVEIELSRNPWGQQVLHVNINGACALRVANGKISLREARDPKRLTISDEVPLDTRSLENVIAAVRFNHTSEAAVLPMTHQAMVKIRVLVNKHFPQNPPLPISYVEGDASTACIITVRGDDHVIAFLFKPKPVEAFVRELPV